MAVIIAVIAVVAVIVVVAVIAVIVVVAVIVIIAVIVVVAVVALIALVAVIVVVAVTGKPTLNESFLRNLDHEDHTLLYISTKSGLRLYVDASEARLKILDVRSRKHTEITNTAKAIWLGLGELRNT